MKNKGKSREKMYEITWAQSKLLWVRLGAPSSIVGAPSNYGEKSFKPLLFFFKKITLSPLSLPRMLFFFLQRFCFFSFLLPPAQLLHSSSSSPPSPPLLPSLGGRCGSSRLWCGSSRLCFFFEVSLSSGFWFFPVMAETAVEKLLGCLRIKWSVKHIK